MLNIALIPYDYGGFKDKILSYQGNTLNCLKKYLKNRGYDLHTIDFYQDVRKIDLVLCFDITPIYFSYKKKLQNIFKNKSVKNFLFIFECPAVSSQNWDKDEHNNFDAIFTWNDDLIDNLKYFKYLWIQNGYESLNKRTLKNDILEKKSKFLTLINANKYSLYANELYSERRKAIYFFEKKIPSDFDLYGWGWNKPYQMKLNDMFISPFNATRSFIESYKTPNSYRGSIEDKFSVLAKYKFAICYENMTNVKGYITEKIWDCFRVRTIPIYFGADNIGDYIPRDCYIDKRYFEKYEQLLDYITHMGRDRYLEYIRSIDEFVSTKTAQNWFGSTWAKNVGAYIISLISPKGRHKRNIDYKLSFSIDKYKNNKKNDIFIFTEICNCGKIGKLAIESFLKHHSNLDLHIYGTPADFLWITTQKNLLFHDISQEKEIIKGFKEGHLGTARLWAKIIQEIPNKYIVHFDSDVIFLKNALRDIILKLTTGYDLVGTIRNYKNNPQNIKEIKHYSDVCQTAIFGFNKNKIGHYDKDILVKMCQGVYNPLGHPVIDYFDPVMFDILKNGGKIYHLSMDQYGGFDEYGKKNTGKYGNLNKDIDFGDNILHFSAVGSGMNFYFHQDKIKAVPDSYKLYALEKYSLFCKLFYNEDTKINLDFGKYGKLIKAVSKLIK